MKKNRFLALLCAVLLALSCVTPAFAIIAVQDADGSIHYSTEDTTTAPSPAKEAVQKVMKHVRDYGRRWGVLTVAIVLIVGIVAAVTISEFERQKKEQAGKPPKRSKKNR